MASLLLKALRTICILLMQSAARVLGTSSGDSCQQTGKEFLRAVMAGDEEVIQRCLEGGMSANGLYDYEGTQISSLQLACAFGQVNSVKRLLQANADVDFQILASPIYIASQFGHLPVVDLLIKAQADIDLLSRAGGASPILVAAQNGHHDVVNLLISAQAKLDVPETDGCSPVFIAAQNGHQKVVDFLIKAQADVNLQSKIRSSPLYIASQNGHYAIVDLLIKAKANFNSQSTSITDKWPLYVASQNGHQQVVDLLIKAHADVNHDSRTGKSPLYIASQNGHLQVVDSLIKAQADVNYTRKTAESPLHIASWNGFDEIVNLLIRSQAKVNFQSRNGYSPLHMASRRGHYKVVDALIRANADVDLQTSIGYSPLYIASCRGHHQVSELLVKAQADVNLESRRGYSPLHVASQEDHHQIVELLIKAQADIDRQTNLGHQPLYIASHHGHHRVVDSLIKAQADVNLKSGRGYSPLHIASQKGYFQVAKSLVNAQADIYVETICGEQPVRLALQRGHTQIVHLLIEAQVFPLIHTVDSREEILRPAAPDESIGPLPGTAEADTPSDPELSQQLHSALTQAGFVDSRAALQSAAADVLQELLRKRLDSDDVFVVGSFSEGWGNSLSTLNGRPDIESDIDMMRLIQGQIHHPRDICECGGASIQQDYTNGHIMCPGFASNPALPSLGSPLRPAVDIVSADRLCRYPPIAPLQPHRVSISHLPNTTLKSLQNDVTSNTSSPCHVVFAASPGRGGEELRVSTSFLEKRMLRSLTTLQGQLFVTLKYLVKKVICHRDVFSIQGVKPYHVKTITFRMLEETPAEQWKPENLVSLTRRSLQMLLHCVESSRTPDNAHGRIMEHFFLSDAALYLKGVNRQDSDQTLSSIAEALRIVVDLLPQLLLLFMSSLRPVSESGRFYFHPFQILPDLSSRPLPKSISLEYHEIYDVVRECLLRLSHEVCSAQSQESLTELIARLPDCAFSAREALRALACLMFGDRDAAEKVVSQSRGHEVSKGIYWSTERSATEATAQYMWRHLTSQDSAWKFCFKFNQRIEFRFATGVLRECFPMPMTNSIKDFFMNFDALLWALRFELQTVDEASVREWIRDVAHKTDSDEQELLVAALHSESLKEVLALIEKQRHLSDAVPHRVQDMLMRKWQLQAIH